MVIEDSRKNEALFDHIKTLIKEKAGIDVKRISLIAHNEVGYLDFECDAHALAAFEVLAKEYPQPNDTHVSLIEPLGRNVF